VAAVVCVIGGGGRVGGKLGMSSIYITEQGFQNAFVILKMNYETIGFRIHF